MNEDIPEVIEGEFIPYDENLEPVAIEEEAAVLYNFCGSWHLYICRFVFGHSTFLSLHSCLLRALRVVL